MHDRRHALNNRPPPDGADHSQGRDRPPGWGLGKSLTLAAAVVVVLIAVLTATVGAPPPATTTAEAEPAEPEATTTAAEPRWIETAAEAEPCLQADTGASDNLMRATASRIGAETLHHHGTTVDPPRLHMTFSTYPDGPRSVAVARLRTDCHVEDLSVGPARTEAAPAATTAAKPAPARSQQPATTTPRPTTTTTSTAAAWYAGGTLHKANAQQWRRGSDRDRLATAADWATVSLGREKVREWGSMDPLRPYAEALLRCANEAVADPRINVSMSGIAATCWILIYGAP